MDGDATEARRGEPGTEPAAGQTSRRWPFWVGVAALSVALVAAVAIPGRDTDDHPDLRAEVRAAEAELDDLSAEVDALAAQQAVDQTRIDAYRALRNPEGVQAVAALNNLVAQEVCEAIGPVDRDQVVAESVEAVAALFPALDDIEDAAFLVDDEAFNTERCPDPVPPPTEPPPTTAPAPTTAPPTSTAPPATTAPPAPSPGSTCALGSDPDCIDTDGDGSGTYLTGGAECMASFPDSPGLCSDLDGDGNAGYPDSG